MDGGGAVARELFTQVRWWRRRAPAVMAIDQLPRQLLSCLLRSASQLLLSLLLLKLRAQLLPLETPPLRELQVRGHFLRGTVRAREYRRK